VTIPKAPRRFSEERHVAPLQSTLRTETHGRCKVLSEHELAFIASSALWAKLNKMAKTTDYNGQTSAQMVHRYAAIASLRTSLFIICEKLRGSRSRVSRIQW
jgi:hypothetical protein